MDTAVGTKASIFSGFVKIILKLVVSIQAERGREQKILQDGVDDLRHCLDHSEEDRRITQAQLSRVLLTY
jgi:hypothetical protein